MSALVSFTSRVVPCTRGLHYGVPLASAAVTHAVGETKPSYVPRPSAKGRALDKVEIPQKLKDKYFVRIGNRDIVGYGIHGNPEYFDREEVPFPGVRFLSNTPEVLKLRQKEAGDWTKLSLEDKKALYRASFRQTFSEMKYDTKGQWKRVIGLTGMGLAAAILISQLWRSDMPRLWTEEQLAELYLDGIKVQIDQRRDPIKGYASKWNYETNQWK
jgi:cytochrome c oxidase subunit 4